MHLFLGPWNRLGLNARLAHIVSHLEGKREKLTRDTTASRQATLGLNRAPTYQSGKQLLLATQVV
jgi:hypothetical protein